MRQKFRVLTLTTMAILCALAVQAQNYSDGLAAIVRDKVITVYDLHRESQAAEAELRNKFTGEELARKLSELRTHMAEQLIAHELIYAEFEQKGGRIPKELVQGRLDHIIASETGGNRQMFEQRLHDQEMTMTDVEERLTKAIAVEMMLQEEIFRKVQVSPSEVNQYYRDNPELFVQEPQVRLQIIMLQADNDGKLPEIQAQLREGKDFGTLAKTYSEHDSASRHGELGWARVEDLIEAFKEAIQPLAPGETAAPVTLDDNLYLLHVAERNPGGRVKLDQQLREQISQLLERQEKARRYDEYIAKLKQKYFVRTFF